MSDLEVLLHWTRQPKIWFVRETSHKVWRTIIFSIWGTPWKWRFNVCIPERNETEGGKNSSTATASHARNCYPLNYTIFLLKGSFKHQREKGGKNDMLHCPKLNWKMIDTDYHLVIYRKASTFILLYRSNILKGIKKIYKSFTNQTLKQCSFQGARYSFKKK